MGKMPAIGLIGLMGAGLFLTGCDSVKSPDHKTYTTGSTWQSKPLFGSASRRESSTTDDFVTVRYLA